MGETIDDVVERLRKLAVEMVRTRRLSDAAAVLSGVGALEMMDAFAGGNPPARSHTAEPVATGQHRAPDFDQI
jgi:hypothetical protein